MTLECPEQAGPGFQRESMVAPSVVILPICYLRTCYSSPLNVYWNWISTEPTYFHQGQNFIPRIC